MIIHSFFRICAVVACFALLGAQELRADADFERAAKGLTLSSVKGRTLVGMTRDGSKTWSVYLASNGQAQFNFSTGNSASARWYIDSKNILCFKGLIKENPRKEICKLTTPRGRGMDWLTVELYEKNGQKLYRKAVKDERRGSSQIVYSHAGKAYVSKSSYRSDLREWRGRVVVGRTLKDKEAWAVHLRRDGSFSFAFGSGKRYAGKYTLTRGQICLSFPSRSELNGCRKPRVSDGKILWASSKDGSAISEVVYLHKPSAKPATKKTPKPKPQDLYASVARKIGEKYLERNLGALPGDKVLVQAGPLSSKLTFVDAARPRVLASLTIENRLRASDLNGYQLAWAGGGGAFSVWNLFDSTKLSIRNFKLEGETLVDIAISKNGEKAALVTAKPASIVVFDTASQTEDFRIEFGPDETVLLEGFTELGTMLHYRKGRESLHRLDLDTRAEQVIEAQAGHEILDFEIFANGVRAVVSEANSDENTSRGFITTYVSRGGKWVRQTRKEVFRGRPWSVSTSHDGRELLVTFSKRGIYAYNLSGLSGEKLVLPGKTGSVAHFGARGDFSLSSGLDKGVDYYGRTKSAAQNLRLSSGQSTFELAGLINTEDKAVRARIAEKEAEYAAFKELAHANYNAGRCAAYEAVAGELKSKDRFDIGCAEAKVAREKMADYETALIDLDCGRAEELSQIYGIGASGDITRCRQRAQRRDDLLAYSSAVKARDCARVEELEGRLGKSGGAAACEMNKAMEADSPRRMFLAAVKFDTKGEFANAKKIYEAIMERFPDDDVALDAATRVIALTDQLRAEKKAARESAETKAALAEAKREAEEAKRRAAKAERAAEREKKEREAKQKVEKRKRERLAEVKRRLSELNTKYGLHSGYHSVSATVDGRERWYSISGSFKISPTTASPSTAREFCKVRIESSTYPRYKKINYGSNNRYYFTPRQGRSAFIINLMDKGRSDGFGFGGNHLFKKSGEKKVAFTTTQNADSVEIDWATSVQKLYQEGDHYKSGSRVTQIQVFKDIGATGAGKHSFFNDFRKLIEACWFAREN